MDNWTWIAYILGILLNIGAVGIARVKAYKACKKWLESGRTVVFVVYALVFLELLVVGKFEAFQSADAFVALLKQVAEVGSATLGTHVIGKSVWNVLFGG
jgi:hypothetical protein